jgi:hypothetical protein
MSNPISSARGWLQNGGYSTAGWSPLFEHGGGKGQAGPGDVLFCLEQTPLHTFFYLVNLAHEHESAFFFLWDFSAELSSWPSSRYTTAKEIFKLGVRP